MKRWWRGGRKHLKDDRHRYWRNEGQLLRCIQDNCWEIYIGKMVLKNVINVFEKCYKYFLKVISVLSILISIFLYVRLRSETGSVAGAGTLKNYVII